MNEISINNLNYNYYDRIKNTSTKALANINLSFQRGMRILVCGKNGAGKSTLLSIIAGKKLIKEEEVLVFNKPAFHDTTLSNKIGFVGEWWSDEYILNITIKDLFSQYRNSKRYKNLLKLFEIDENKLITSISKGEKKKVQILANIIKRKDIYIFDEVTESLDLVSRKLLLEFLKKECIRYNCIIIYSTHIFDHMEKWCSHILYLSNGYVAHFSDINSVINDNSYVSLAEYIFNKMLMELKEKENINDLDDLLLIDSE
ncbi:CCR4-associated factor 16, putative [Plasmodium relictum]|uniref:CCR4-associated factor 16, putative n=1 Tax=Plasmodium relictum TaxID=85471 RepID=A0A1J1HHQ7_PLARL|nr:CCR4-associated factor 16, putative [Plasmodium relictum]CRH03812.1 CCR4-associated factor 16, putative [Plasmodium relictum]